MEKKLQLVQQIRSRYHENQYDMSNRERILYGRSRDPLDAFPEPDLEQPHPSSLFRVRLLVALLLFGLIVAMDRGGFQVAGLTADKILEAISADYEDALDQWVEAMSDSSKY